MQHLFFNIPSYLAIALVIVLPQLAVIIPFLEEGAARLASSFGIWYDCRCFCLFFLKPHWLFMGQACCYFLR